LKQAPNQWHQKFNKVIVDFRFTINERDKYIYSKVIDKDYLILCLYVNDTLIFEISLEVILKVKDYLAQNFDMTDLGRVDMILGMKISVDPRGIFLGHSHSIEKILHKFDYYTCKHISILFDSSISLRKNTGNSVS